MHHNFFSLNFPRCCWNPFYLILNSCINKVYWKCAVFLAHRVYGAASYHLTASSVTSVHTYQRSCLTPLPPVSCNWRQHNYWYSDNIPTTFAFSTLTLLVGRQEEYSVCKNWVTRCWCGICLQRGADCLHMFQLMPLLPKALPSLASFKSRLVLHFWYRLTRLSWKEAVKRV